MLGSPSWLEGRTQAGCTEGYLRAGEKHCVKGEVYIEGGTLVGQVVHHGIATGIP